MKSESNVFALRVNSHRRILYKYTYNLCRDYDLSKDLVGETIFRALKYQHSFKDGTNLKAWLSVIAYSVFVNHYRISDYRRSRLQGYNRQEITYNLGESEISAEFIQESIDDLPIRYRKTVQLWLAGYDLKSISKELSIPLGTVKSRIHKGKAILVHCLQELCD